MSEKWIKLQATFQNFFKFFTNICEIFEEINFVESLNWLYIPLYLLTIDKA